MSTTFGTKHRHKVDECYPSNPGEEGPVSGKISSLTYYINARPEKLLKVSAYMEKKVQKDIVKARTGYNKVTLDIVDGIMKGCSEYFATFAPTALRIINTFSQTNNVELLCRIAETFAKFSNLAKAILPLISDDEFFEVYSKFVSNMLGRLKYEKSGNDSERILVVQLQIIDAVVSIEDFKTSRGKDRVNEVVSFILDNLGRISKNYENVTKTLFQSLMENTISVHLLQALKILLQNSNTISIQLIDTAFFSYFSLSNWENSELASIVFKMITKEVPSQLLCAFLTDLFRELNSTTEEGVACMADGLGELLLSNRGPLGYSAVAISRNLLRLLRKERPSTSGYQQGLAYASQFSHPSKNVFAICNSMVCILRNANFAPQKYDIINQTIIKAFYPQEAKRSRSMTGQHGQGMTLEHQSLVTVTLDSNEEFRYFSVIWSVLFAMAREPLPLTVVKMAFLEIPVKLYETLFVMMNEADADFRLNSLVLYQQLLANGLSFSGHVRPTLDLSDSGNMTNIATLHNTVSLNKTAKYLFGKSRVGLFRSALKPGNSSHHYSAILSVLKSMLLEADMTHIFKSLSIGLELQQFLADVGSEEQACLLLLFISQYFSMIANRLKNFDIDLLAKKIIASLKEKGARIFELETVLDTHPPPLCVVSSLSSSVKEPIIRRKDLSDVVVKCCTDEETKTMGEEIIGKRYSPEEDLNECKDPRLEFRNDFDSVLGVPKSSTQGDHMHTRRSYATLNSQSSNVASRLPRPTTTFSVARSIDLGMKGNPTSVFRLGLPGTLTGSASSLSTAGESSIGDAAEGETNILEADFENLNIRNREKRRELKQKSKDIFRD